MKTVNIKIMGYAPSQTISKICNSIYILLFFYTSVAFSQYDGYLSNEAFLMTNNLSSSGAGGSNFSGVDMFRGKANTTIPIYNHKGREIDLPISLSYVASGIKVDQVAGSVGLGWQLNAGGRIDRVVTKIPDDNIYPSTETANCSKREIANFLTADFYKVSAPGYEDVFKYAHGAIPQSFKSLKNPKNTIVRTDNTGPEKWRGDGEYVITAPDGTQYYFGYNDAKEKIYSVYNTAPLSSSCPPIQVESTTAMMLTKIVSKNRLDEYVFNYKAFVWTDSVSYRGDGHSFYNQTTQQVEYFLHNYSYKLRQQGLTSIYHNGEKIIGFEYDNNRLDLNFANGEGFKLSKILFYNFKSTSTFRTANFTYTYFGVPAPAVNPGNPGFEQRRLKLDNLTFYGFQGTTPIAGDAYGFNYISPELVPKLSSNSKDLMGFYNGVITNTHLLYNEPTIQGSIRTHVFDKSIIGTLDKITYPTKGYTKFEYEQNALKGGFGHDIIPGGLVTVYDKQELTFVCAGSDYMSCELADNSQAHPSMERQLLSSYPNSSIHYPPSGESPYYLRGVKSALLRIDANTGKNVTIHKEGHGVYMIQKIQGCNSNNDYTLTCASGTGNIVREFPQNDGCLHPMSQLYNTPTAHSQPSEYIIGGLIRDAVDLTVNYTFQDYGTYQVTVWAYTPFFGGTFDNYSGATVDIYKLNPRTVTLPDQAINRDVTDCTVDGFRIKSITNFTANDVFASKKMYKYSGYMVDRIPGANVLYTGTSMRSSRGFANSEIIHYQKVYEIPVDANNTHNGYVEYLFKDFDYADHPNCDYRFSPTSVTPFFYNNLNGEEVKTNYVEGRFDLIHQKHTYNKNEKRVRSEVFTYDDIEFDNQCFCGPWYVDSEKYHFTFLKNSNIKDFAADNTFIEKNIAFEYSDFKMEAKTIDHGTRIENEFYRYNQQEINSPVMQNQLTLVMNPQTGNKKFNYADFNGRYFVSEVQTATYNGPYETKLKYEYDTDGNAVTTIKFTPGTLAPTSYETTIWGYGNRLPVATVSGKKYSEIPLATLAIINEIKAASNLPVTVANENTLRTKLDALRTALPECQVTTSTYNPVFGVTSTTDAKGYTLYYEYDALGRLRFTKEKNAAGTIVILSENNYNNRAN